MPVSSPCDTSSVPSLDHGQSGNDSAGSLVLPQRCDLPPETAPESVPECESADVAISGVSERGDSAENEVNAKNPDNAMYVNLQYVQHALFSDNFTVFLNQKN